MNPFSKLATTDRTWLKGNLHTHTTQSDGAVGVIDRIQEYVDAGYDFLSITDHHHITPVAEHSERSPIVLIPGVELHPRNPYGGPLYHILAHNVHEEIDARAMAPQDVIDGITSQGGVAWLAHPYWNDLLIERDVLPLTGWAGVEVFNSACARAGRGESSVHWDQWMKHTRAPIPAIATDDAHTRPDDGDDRFQGYTWVWSLSREPADILDALVAGMSYSSSGPTIHVVRAERVQDDRAATKPIVIEVESSPIIRLSAVCDAFGGDYPPGPPTGEFTRGVVRVPECQFVRLELTDAMGRKAWTNPLRAEDLL